MSERPILMNSDMVRAILEGRKTVTRRAIKPQPDGRPVRMAESSCYPDCFAIEGTSKVVRPPYQPGNILWVRETWCESLGQAGKYFYRAYAGPRDEMKEYAHSFNRWRPSIHMPRAAARIFLRVNNVRVERLQDITEDDAKAEGAQKMYPYTDPETGKTAFLVHDEGTYRIGFFQIWDSTIKPKDRVAYCWESTPWVWVIEFERIKKEEADLDE